MVATGLHHQYYYLYTDWSITITNMSELLTKPIYLTIQRWILEVLIAHFLTLLVSWRKSIKRKDGLHLCSSCQVAFDMAAVTSKHEWWKLPLKLTSICIWMLFRLPSNMVPESWPVIAHLSCEWYWSIFRTELIVIFPDIQTCFIEAWKHSLSLSGHNTKRQHPRCQKKWASLRLSWVATV